MQTSFVLLALLAGAVAASPASVAAPEPATTTVVPEPAATVAHSIHGVQGGFATLQKRATGEGTYYDVGLGACESSNSNSEMVAALNHAQYGSGSLARRAISSACGKQVCVTGPKGQVKVKIVDMCPGCAAGDLDLSPAAFNAIADPAQGRVGITWSQC